MSGGTLATLRSFPRPFRVLLAGVVVNRLATFIIPFLTLVLTRDHGFSAAGAGAVILAYGAGTLLSLLLGGLLTDALGRRRTILLSLFLAGGIAVILGFVEETIPFVSLLMAYGFVSDLYRPAVASVIGDLLRPERRAQGYAALRTAVNLGWAVGLSLGGILADLGPRILFLGDGATTLAFGFIVLAGVPETRAAGAPSTPLRPSDLLRPLVEDPVFRRSCAAAAAWGLLVISWMTVFPLTVAAAGHPALVYGVVMGWNGLLVALFQLPVAAAVGPRRRLRAAAAGMALGGACVAAIPLVPHPSAWIALMTVYTLGEMLVIPQATAFVSDWAPPERRGSYLGIHGACSYNLVFAVAPLVLLQGRLELGDRLYWPALALLAVAPGVLLLRGLDRDADRPGLLRGAAPGPGKTGGAEGGT